MANKGIQEKITHNGDSNNDDLKLFIEKKRIQNEALKKLISKLNAVSDADNKKCKSIN